MDLAGDPAVEAQLVGGGDREAGLVFPAGDVVGLDRVEALAGADVEAPLERLGEAVEAADVEPALVREAFVAAADHRAGELRRRRAGSSPSCRRRGSRSTLRPWRCSAAHRRRRRFEAVDVVDRRRRRRCRSCPAAATARARWSAPGARCPAAARLGNSGDRGAPSAGRRTAAGTASSEPAMRAPPPPSRRHLDPGKAAHRQPPSAGASRQPRAPEREEADGERGAGPVQGERAPRRRLGRPARTAPVRAGTSGRPQHPRGEGGAEHPGGRAGDPAPVDEEVVGEGERRGRSRGRRRRASCSSAARQSGRGSMPDDSPAGGYSTTILPCMKGWIVQW